ncbi:transposase [Streptococcus lutetiensis]|nr:transposase [Streptococcus lutetiensis]
MTLVERQTRFAIAVKLANKQAETINRAVKSLLSHRTMAQSSVACQT